jgi:hypothetical protein
LQTWTCNLDQQRQPQCFSQIPGLQICTEHGLEHLKLESFKTLAWNTWCQIDAIWKSRDERFVIWLPLFQCEYGSVNHIFQFHFICVPDHPKFIQVSDNTSSLIKHTWILFWCGVKKFIISECQPNVKSWSLEPRPPITREKEFAHLFSRNVFALQTFLPIAVAFQGKYEPEGSIYT